ncbi:hypothetical protein [Rhizobium sullae]|uniref:hypothetical protein n=1 Tax=Rhizobium sullae TaxID=50338 RepID=UPI0012FDE9AD|nr:hypothetical protein [Rhizobium sullae]
MADAKAQGVTMARVHAASNVYPRWNFGRYDLDLNHLLHRPLASVSALGTLPADSLKSLSDLAVRLSSTVAATKGLTRVRCHGGCNGAMSGLQTIGRLVLYELRGRDGGMH